jgi:thiopeptide-type bacteriocin biosynthesis protein
VFVVPSRLESTPWLGIHIPVGAPICSSRCDQFLIDVVRPVAESACAMRGVSGYFFVRYTERSHHIRLRIRIQDVDVVENVMAIVEQQLALHGRHVGTPQGFAVGSTGLGALQCEWVQYEPEVDRYGGADGIRLAEELFIASSKFALSTIDQAGTNFSRFRLGFSAASMFVAARALHHDMPSVLSYMDHCWRPYVGHAGGSLRSNHTNLSLSDLERAFSAQSDRWTNLIDRLCADNEADDQRSSFDAYGGALLTTFTHLARLFATESLRIAPLGPTDWLSTASRLLRSYSHMTNNRLGVSIPDEAFVAYAACKALSSRLAACRSQ